MILEQETFDKFGYYPSQLTKGMEKDIIIKCDFCKKIKIRRNNRVKLYSSHITTCGEPKCIRLKTKLVLKEKFGVENVSQIPHVAAKLRKSEKIGTKYGLLTTIENFIWRNGEPFVKCQCSCKKRTIVEKKVYTLKSGHIKSCGCIKYKKITKHGCYRTRLYRIWGSMKCRCYNIKNPGYKNYGGRKIKICDEWLTDFSKFKDWSIKNNYNNNLTIHRINPHEGYNPENCIWISKEDNARRVVSDREDKIKNLKNANWELIQENLQLKIKIALLESINGNI